MSVTHEAAEWVRLFPSEEIRFILEAVLRCSTTLRKRDATELENRINNRLRKLLIQDIELRQRPIQVDCETLVYDEDTDGENPAGRLDFRFLYPTGVQKPWPYFAIEAKRLHVALRSGWKSLVHEYVTSDQGMMCFIEQRYSQHLASGGMLGYVFDGDITKARASVAAAISANRTKLKSAPRSELVLSAVLPEESGVGQTVHALPHGDFVIYHLFIAV